MFVDIETSSRVVLDDGTVLDRCYHCRVGWKERNERGIEGGPVCEGCRIGLKEENNDAAQVYMMTRGQVITRSKGMDGDYIYDLNLFAVKSVMDALEIINQSDCIKKVHRVFHHILARGLS